ncbi:MAG: barstar family protein [Candidatus Eremiobacteraeota bacterium]|nr:barstar family protein [Candidatus Eremiobacteraeota bacterium]
MGPPIRLKSGQLAGLLTEARARGWPVYHLAGPRCKQELLEQLAEVFGFPEYFGYNWDALEECLGDLGWLDPASTRLLVWEECFRLAQASLEDWRTALSVLAEVPGLKVALLHTWWYEAVPNVTSSSAPAG